MHGIENRRRGAFPSRNLADVGEDGIKHRPGFFPGPVGHGNALQRLHRRRPIGIRADEARQRLESVGFLAANGSNRVHGGVTNSALGGFAADLVYSLLVRSGQPGFLKHDALVLVEHREGEPVQALAEIVIAAVMDNNGVDKKLRSQVDLPPGIIGVFLTVSLPAVAPFAAGVAVDGPARVAAACCVFLGCLALAGDVAAVAVDFHLGKGQRFPLARQLNANMAPVNRFTLGQFDG